MGRCAEGIARVHTARGGLRQPSTEEGIGTPEGIADKTHVLSCCSIPCLSPFGDYKSPAVCDESITRASSIKVGYPGGIRLFHEKGLVGRILIPEACLSTGLKRSCPDPTVWVQVGLSDKREGILMKLERIFTCSCFLTSLMLLIEPKDPDVACTAASNLHHSIALARMTCSWILREKKRGVR